jgi:hypothetical protein
MPMMEIEISIGTISQERCHTETRKAMGRNSTGGAI